MRALALVAPFLLTGTTLAAPSQSTYTHSLTKRDALMSGTQVAVFWGQSTLELSDVCSSDDYDVIILAFLTSLIPPKLNLGKNSGAASQAQQAKNSSDGWDLFDATQSGESGTSVADQISACQSGGKKVMISFGGTTGISNAVFSSDDEATEAAGNLWNLFLGGTDDDVAPLRPFGKDVKLDGVDLDNETGDGSHYDTFVKAVKDYYSKDTSKSYYISADPMCGQAGKTGTDTSIPQAAMSYIDWMNIQFYNNEASEIGSDGFEDNIKKWDSQLSSVDPSPKLVVGIPGGGDAADKGSIQTADQISKSIASIKGMSLKNLGGVAIWDAGRAAENDGFSDAIKKAL